MIHKTQPRQKRRNEKSNTLKNIVYKLNQVSAIQKNLGVLSLDIKAIYIPFKYVFK